MASDIVGKWKVDSGQFMGLTYDFKENGDFQMEMSMYGVKGSGNYTTNDSKSPNEIDINFTEHTSGAAGIGVYKGIWERDGKVLKMKVGTANGDRWTDPTAYITYIKV